MNTYSSCDLSLIVPAFNEEIRIKNTIDILFKCICESKLRVQVIVINDGSTDQTLQILEDIKRKNEITIIHNETNLGIGGSLKKGIENSLGNSFAIIPGDGDLNEIAIKNILKYVNKADTVLFYFQDDYLRGWLRRFISRLYSLILTTFSRISIQYIHAPGLYKTELIDLRKIKKTNYFFISELNIEAYKKSKSILEIPLLYSSPIASGGSFRFRSIIKLLLFIIEIIHKYRFDSYHPERVQLDV